VKHFRELTVWQRSLQLSVAIYALTREFPREETYGLTSQMRRASVSILSNIAEGQGRSSRVQYAHFVSMAKGSCYELEAQLFLVEALGYGAHDRQVCARGLQTEVGKMLTSMLEKLQAPEPSDLEPRT
jgi:four helix bundle protein